MGINSYRKGGGGGGGRVVRWCWVNFQCRGVLQFGYSRARAYCARSRCGWGCLDIFTLIYPFSPLSPSLWETARYRLKYCLKGPLNPKQPTNQPYSKEFALSRAIKGSKQEVEKLIPFAKMAEKMQRFTETP